jgi:ubiquinone/menaquinone biosynthesis C-methylase UbiE
MDGRYSSQEIVGQTQHSLFVELTGAEVMEDQVTTAFAALHFRQWIPLLLRDVTLAKGMHILDMGCGKGEWVTPLGMELDDPPRKDPDVCITGIDNRPHRIAHAQAQAKYMENVSFQVENLCQMTLPSNTYDLVHLRGLACSLSSECYPLVLTFALRVLRPGGMIVCTEFTWPKTNASGGLAVASLIRLVLLAVNYTSIQVEQGSRAAASSRVHACAGTGNYRESVGRNRGEPAADTLFHPFAALFPIIPCGTEHHDGAPVFEIVARPGM